MIVQILVSITATISFAVLFNAPKKQYLFCGITGAVGWTTYLLMTQRGLSASLACVCATLALTILSRCLSVARRVPATIFLVTGIFPLVPGAGIYYTAYYLIANDVEMASVKGVETFKIAGAIVLGIIFAFSIPQNLFNLIRNISCFRVDKL